MRVLVLFKNAFIDALKNTFNLNGRTNRQGFWLFVLPHAAFLFALYWICFLTEISPPGDAFIVLMTLPLAGLFFRRGHDVSFSWSESVLLALATLWSSFYTRTDITYIPFGYLLFRFCWPSAENNRHGPKPAHDLITTFPENPEKRRIKFVCVFLCMLHFVSIVPRSHVESLDCQQRRDFTCRIKQVKKDNLNNYIRHYIQAGSNQTETEDYLYSLGFNVSAAKRGKEGKISYGKNISKGLIMHVDLAIWVFFENGVVKNSGGRILLTGL